jgi:hypothetical protein
MIQFVIMPLSCLRRIKPDASESLLVPIMHTIVREAPRLGPAQQTVLEAAEASSRQSVLVVHFTQLNTWNQQSLAGSSCSWGEGNIES